MGFDAPRWVGVSVAQRGEVWLVDLGEPIGREQDGRRPAVVVSADRWNELPSGVVVIVPITTARRDLEIHVELESGDSGLDVTSYAKTEEMRSISDQRLLQRLGRIGPAAQFAIGRALRFVLEL